jgi:membrane protease YdiL (CAAX protease family)
MDGIICGGIFALVFVGYIIYSANQQPPMALTNFGFRWLLYAVTGINLMFGVGVLQTVILSNDSAVQQQLIEFGIKLGAMPISTGVIAFFLAAATSIFAFVLIGSPRLRLAVKGVVRESGSYDPESAVHTAAVVLMLAVISSNIVSFLLAGGIAGMAADVETEGISLATVFFQQVLWIFSGLLGIGFAIRRDVSQTLVRLGLRLPTISDIVAGVIAATLGIVLVIVVSLAWSLVTSPEQLQQQTAPSEQIAASFSTLPQAFLVALMVAFGEEIFFRGAFQPTFGIVLTSIFFTATHTQYALSPATLVVFLVSLGFGWLRQRYSTSSSIIAHFVYNFIQLAVFTAGVAGGI